MQTFVRVVDSGSFSAAARVANRSKARVSQAISALEADLGITLLHRTTRSLRLTEAGTRYHKSCVELLAAVEATESQLRSGRDALEGTLRVSAPPGLASRYLHQLTAGFVANHPGVRIDLDLTHRMVDLVEEGVDVAIRVTEPQDSSLVAQKLMRAPIVLVGAPSYLESNGTPRSPEALKDHECLVDSNFRDQQRWRFQVGKKAVTVAVTGSLRVNSSEAIRRLAVAGHGIALCPRFMVEDDLRQGKLSELLVNTVALDWAVYAIYPRRTYLPERVRAYVAHMRQALHLEE